jgi:hypothetical protein
MSARSSSGKFVRQKHSNQRSSFTTLANMSIQEQIRREEKSAEQWKLRARQEQEEEAARVREEKMRDLTAQYGNPYEKGVAFSQPKLARQPNNILQPPSPVVLRVVRQVEIPVDVQVEEKEVVQRIVQTTRKKRVMTKRLVQEKGVKVVKERYTEFVNKPVLRRKVAWEKNKKTNAYEKVGRAKKTWERVAVQKTRTTTVPTTIVKEIEVETLVDVPVDKLVSVEVPRTRTVQRLKTVEIEEEQAFTFVPQAVGPARLVCTRDVPQRMHTSTPSSSSSSSSSRQSLSSSSSSSSRQHRQPGVSDAPSARQPAGYEDLTTVIPASAYPDQQQVGRIQAAVNKLNEKPTMAIPTGSAQPGTSSAYYNATRKGDARMVPPAPLTAKQKKQKAEEDERKALRAKLVDDAKRRNAWKNKQAAPKPEPVSAPAPRVRPASAGGRINWSLREKKKETEVTAKVTMTPRGGKTKAHPRMTTTTTTRFVQRKQQYPIKAVPKKQGRHPAPASVSHKQPQQQAPSSSYSTTLSPASSKNKPTMRGSQSSAQLQRPQSGRLPVRRENVRVRESVRAKKRRTDITQKLGLTGHSSWFSQGYGNAPAPQPVVVARVSGNALPTGTRRHSSRRAF